MPVVRGPGQGDRAEPDEEPQALQPVGAHHGLQRWADRGQQRPLHSERQRRLVRRVQFAVPASGQVRQPVSTLHDHGHLPVHDQQVGRLHGHCLLRAAQKGRPRVDPARRSPRPHAHEHLDRRPLLTWRSRFILRSFEYFYSRRHVRVLFAGCAGACLAEAALVEEVPDRYANVAVYAGHRSLDATAVHRLQLSQGVCVVLLVPRVPLSLSLC